MILQKLKPAFRLPYLPLWLIPLILVGPTLLSGNAIFWGTPYLQFVPWRAQAWESIKVGVLPLWNPLVGMGAPLLANYQSALLYPPNWLLLIFQAIGGTQAQAWVQALLIGAHMVWAGVGMVQFSRRINLNLLGQTIAGMAFGVSTYLVARSGFLSINAVVAWVPWVMWGADHISGPFAGKSTLPNNWGLGRVFPLALCLGFQLLAGHAQITWYSILLAFFWVSFWSFNQHGLKNLILNWIAFGFAGLLAAGLAAIQLIPTGEYLLQSQRSSSLDFTYAMNYSFWPWHLITLLIPDFFGSQVRGDYWFNAWYWEDAVYIGLLPFLLGILFIIRKHPRNQSTNTKDEKIISGLALFSIITIIASFLFAVGKYTPIFPFLYQHVPTFNMFQAPARISIWAVFVLAMVGGLGVNDWRRPEKRALYWTRLATAGAAAILIGAGVGWLLLANIQVTFIRATAIAGIWAVGIGVLALTAPIDPAESHRIWTAGVVVLVGLDLLVANWGLNPDIASEYYQETPVTLQTILAQSGGQRIFMNNDVENALKFIRSLQVKTFLPGEDWTKFKAYLLPDANVLSKVPSANNFDPLVPGRYAAWFDQIGKLNSFEQEALFRLMGVGVVETLDYREPLGIRFDPVQGAERFHWANCAMGVQNGNDAWRTLIRDIDDQIYLKNNQEVVILEGNANLSGQICLPDPVAKIRVIEENPNRIKLSIQAQKSGWLVQSDVWYPGWSASVDGKNTPLYRADMLFRAVQLPAGTHEVTIEFRPISFYIGAIVSVLTVLFMFYGFYTKRYGIRSLQSTNG